MSQAEKLIFPTVRMVQPRIVKQQKSICTDFSVIMCGPVTRYYTASTSTIYKKTAMQGLAYRATQDAVLHRIDLDGPSPRCYNHLMRRRVPIPDDRYGRSKITCRVVSSHCTIEKRLVPVITTPLFFIRFERRDRTAIPPTVLQSTPW